MKRRFNWLTCIIAILAIIGIIYAFFLIQNSTGKSDIRIALNPYLDVEAIVTDIILDDLHSDCIEPEVCPIDRITIRIDKIDRTGDTNNVIDLEVGEEIKISLKYSARPAILRSDLPPSCRVGEVFKSGSCYKKGCWGLKCGVTSPTYEEKPAEMEGDYIIYHVRQHSKEITEVILPGLKINSRIKIRNWGMPTNEIGDYEIIS